MVALSIWSINIYWYWIFYVLWFIAAYLFLKFITKKRLLANQYPNIQKILEKNLEDIMIFAILWVLIGWRLWEVLIYGLQHYLANPLEIFALRHWWMSFIWWIVGVIISFIIFQRIHKLKRSESFLLFDLIVAILPLGIILGRFWNYLNQELYGIAINNIQRLSWLSYHTLNILQHIHILHVYNRIDDLVRINTNFLSCFFEWIVLLIITMQIIIRRFRTGKYKIWTISWIFLVCYSFVRFFLEYFRQDSQTEFIWFFTKSQRFFILFFILWVIILIKRKKFKF